MRVHFSEVMMKKIVLFLLLLCACSSNMIKMTPAESNEFLKDHFNVYKSSELDNLNEPYRFRIRDCSTQKNPKGVEDCYVIECQGIREHRNCWKTVITGKEAQDLREKLCCRKLSSEERIERLNSCLHQEKDLRRKRQHCFEWLQSLKFESNVDQIEAEKVFNLFCDLDGVVCKKNNQKIGKGSMKEKFQDQTGWTSGSFSFDGPPSSKPTVFLYSIENE